jgi:hypothetical protein
MNGPMHPRFDIGQIGFLATPCSLRPSVIVGAVQRMAAPCYFASTDRDRTPPADLPGVTRGIARISSRQVVALDCVLQEKQQPSCAIE